MSIIGMSLLQREALSTSKYSYIEVLIEAKADVNQVTHSGDTSLGMAAWIDNLHAVKLLIANGASVFHRNKNGHDALDDSRRMYHATDICHSACSSYILRHMLMLTLLSHVYAQGAKHQQMLPLSVVGGHIVLYELIIDYVVDDL